MRDIYPVIALVVWCVSLAFAPESGAQELSRPATVAPATSEVPITGLRAHDTPSDGGQSVTLEWQAKETQAGREAVLVVKRATSRDDAYEAAGEALASDDSFTDTNAQDGIQYYYRLGWRVGADTLLTGIVGPVTSKSNWFRNYRLNALVLTVLMFVLVVSLINVAKKGKGLYIRKIAGLGALDEAIGRATEMGKKMFYIPGIMSLSEIQTIASLSILGYLAKRCAIYGAQLEVPNTDPLTFTAARETVKQAYLEAGKPDQFKEDMVTYITYDQFAFAASVAGKMVREKPAANFLIGSFYAESLIFAETGYSTGAIQIAGTADVLQLPFFVTTCDYTLLGEELYAASAYLSREPVLLGSIKAQDTTKVIIMALMGAGVAALAFGSHFIKTMLLAR